MENKIINNTPAPDICNIFNHETILEIQSYILIKDNIEINIFISKTKECVIIKCISYEIKINPNDFSLMSNIAVKSNDELFNMLIGIFKQNNVFMEEISDKMIKLNLSIFDIIKGNKKTIQLCLMAQNENNGYIVNDLFNKYLKLEKVNQNIMKENKEIKDENEKLKSDILKIKNDLMNMQIQNQNNENKISQLMNSIEYIKNSLNLNNKDNDINKMNSNNNANNNINLNHKTQIIKTKYNNENQIKNNNNNSSREYPHKIGLQNLGQNGYLSTTLHCLANIKKLSEKLLNNYSYLNENTQKLSFAYTSLLYELNNSNSQYINPSNLNSIIGELNPLFQGNQNSDPKNLIYFIIERLHQELKQKMDINLQLQELTSENKDLALQNFFNDLKYNKSYLLETFYGTMETKLKCDKCNTIKYSYKAFNMTEFNLKDVKQDKINCIGLENYNGINLLDCFEIDRKEEILIGDKKIYCNICQSWNSGKFQKNIFNLSQVLIIVLNRGINNQDFNEEFTFPEVIDFRKNNYVINAKSYKKYFLCSIITCFRENSSNVHYVCYCRNKLNEKFVCYDDINVSKNIEIDDAMNFKFFGNYNDKRTPYILFYHYF